MTTAAIPAPAARAPAVRAAWRRYMAAVQDLGVHDEFDRKVIDAVIEHLAEQGQPFSANSMRELLPPVRTCLISRRLIAAQNRGLIVKTGYTPSTLASTHGAVVAVYQPTHAP